MSLSSSAILGWHHCDFPWFFDWRHFPPKVYGRERFDLPHQQQDYILRPRESICWNSPRLISPAQRPVEGDLWVPLWNIFFLLSWLCWSGSGNGKWNNSRQENNSYIWTKCCQEWSTELHIRIIMVCKTKWH